MLTLTPTEIAIYSKRLLDAEAAYNNLLTGKSPKVVVDQNGERVEFAIANASRLAAYILELKRLLGRVEAQVSGPMRVFL